MHEKLILNAEIEKLIRSEEPQIESARTLILLMRNVPLCGEAFIHGRTTKKDDAKICGHASGFGDVSVTDDSTATKEISKNFYLERIGQYKLWRRANGPQEERIVIEHWRKSELVLGDVYYPEYRYYLDNNTRSLEPIAFGHIDLQLIRRRRLKWMEFLLNLKNLLIYVITFGSHKYQTNCEVFNYDFVFVPHWELGGND